MADIDYTNLDYIPGSRDYARFFTSGKATEFERNIMLVLLAAPEQEARNVVMAEALGKTLLQVNGAYGRLGRKAIRFLRIEMKDERALPSHALAWFDHREDGYFYSVMHRSVREALVTLRWMDEARRKYGPFWKGRTEAAPKESYWEGRKREETIISRARNRQARSECIAHYGLKCFACKFDFAAVYGKLGRDFIEVHHLELVSGRLGGEYQIDPVRDLRPVCANCHRMLHRDGLMDIYDLKALLESRRSKRGS